MNNDDIDDVLKEKHIEILNSCNDELISQQMDEFADLIKSFETEQDISNILKYRGKFHFVMGRYDQTLVDLTKSLEFDTNDAFALRYRGETYYIIEKYEESLADLNKLLKIKVNDMWALKAYKEVIRG